LSITLVNFTLSKIINMKSVKIDLPKFAGAITCGAATIFTATGEIQQTIHFAGAVNEIAFFGICGLTATALFISSLSFAKK
jgi:hypothetical protein